jgi:hypothetical protein
MRIHLDIHSIARVFEVMDREARRGVCHVQKVKKTAATMRSSILVTLGLLDSMF